MPDLIYASLSARLDELCAPWGNPNAPGVALAVVQDGQVVCQCGHGSANLEYTIPITPETVFHVASLAKQVTAMAVLLLADSGVLTLDDPVQKHLPDLPDFSHPITVRHLLQHTSGLRDQWELLTLAGWRWDDVITREHILRLVRRQRELNFEPGTAFSYCNTGYTLLADIVAKVSGQPLRQFAHERIFAPMAMRHTHFHDDHEEVVPNRAYSYYPAPGGTGFRKSVLNYATAGATSLLTTAADLARWIANFEHPTVGSPDLLRLMTQPAVLTDGQTAPYGCGVGLGTYRGCRVVQHIGLDAGYRSFLSWFPEKHLGIAVLANRSDIDVRTLTMQIADLFLEQPVEPEVEPETQPSPGADAPPQPTHDLTDDQLQAYAGSYYSEELDTTYRISAEQGELVVRHLRLDDKRLVGSAPDTFRQSPEGPLTVTFVRNGHEIAGFRLDGVRIRHLWFARLP